MEFIKNLGKKIINFTNELGVKETYYILGIKVEKEIYKQAIEINNYWDRRIYDENTDENSATFYETRNDDELKTLLNSNGYEEELEQNC